MDADEVAKVHPLEIASELLLLLRPTKILEAEE